MEEGAFCSDEELTLMLLNNLRMMMQPLELEPNVRDVWLYFLVNCLIACRPTGNAPA